MMRFYNIIVIAVMFMMIYSPPIININVLHIVGGISWIYIIFKNRYISKIIDAKKILNLYILFIIITIYLLLVAAVNGNRIVSSIIWVYWLIDIIPASILITAYLVSHKYTTDDLVNMLLIVGMLQGITALLAFTYPTVQSYFIGRMINYGYQDVYLTISNVRMYGMASNLTFSTPIAQSTLTIISLYYAIYKNWKYIFFTPLLLFSAIINARTSIIIMAIGLMAIFICKRKLSFKQFFKTLVIFSAIKVVLEISMMFIHDNAHSTYYWILMGYEQILMFFRGDTSYGYFNYATNSQIYLMPEGLSLLFGVGIRIMGANIYNLGSDIGYLNDLWLGGLLYCVIIYMLFIRILFGIYSADGKKYSFNKFIFIFFSGILLVSNFKGYIFNSNNFTVILCILYIFITTRKVSNSHDLMLGKK